MNKILPGLRFVASYSGGKDSMLAIHRAVQGGMTLQALLITYNTERGRSWFHGIPDEVLREVEQAAGVPVRLIRTTGAQYAADFEAALRREKELGAGAVVFGDIDIQGHLDWGTERCRAAGLEACFPLWQEDRLALVRECLASGFKPVITVVDTRRLPADLAGQALTGQLLAVMERAGADPCGENGEYHTFVPEGPVFTRPIPVAFGAPRLENGYAVAPLELRPRAGLAQGRVQVYTGNGKGKTTASMGLMLRAAGAGLKSYFGQFMKRGEMSEIRALRAFLGGFVTVEQYGSGGELSGPDRERDARCAREGYEKARAALTSGRYDLVVLDEINVAAHLGLLSEEDLLRLMDERPARTELIFTGRYAPPAVLSRADLVTEMGEVRHYYADGLPARVGIEM